MWLQGYAISKEEEKQDRKPIKIKVKKEEKPPVKIKIKIKDEKKKGN